MSMFQSGLARSMASLGDIGVGSNDCDFGSIPYLWQLRLPRRLTLAPTVWLPGPVLGLNCPRLTVQVCHHISAAIPTAADEPDVIETKVDQKALNGPFQGLPRTLADALYAEEAGHLYILQDWSSDLAPASARANMVRFSSLAPLFASNEAAQMSSLSGTMNLVHRFLGLCCSSTSMYETVKNSLSKTSRGFDFKSPISPSYPKYFGYSPAASNNLCNALSLPPGQSRATFREITARSESVTMVIVQWATTQ